MIIRNYSRFNRKDDIKIITISCLALSSFFNMAIDACFFFIPTSPSCPMIDVDVILVSIYSLIAFTCFASSASLTYISSISSSVSSTNSLSSFASSTLLVYLDRSTNRSSLKFIYNIK